MLTRCIEFLEQSSFGERSLREIARGAGTSHRMLLYHFGSRDGLLAAVVGRIEQQQRELMAALADQGDDLVTISRSLWKHFTDPALAPAERLFFEIYAQALHNPQWAPRFREAVISAWEEPLAAVLRRNGFTRTQAARRARLSLALTRGLLLDLLLTGDRRTTTAAADLATSLLTAPVS